MAIAITPERLYQKAERPLFFSLRTTGGIVFLASFLLALAAFLGWAGFSGFALKLEGDIKAFADEEVEAKRAWPPKAEAEVLSSVSRAKQLEALVGGHRSGRAALTFLQDRVQPDVVFANFDINYEKGEVSFLVRAPTFAKVAQQVQAFEGDSRVTRVVAEQFSHKLETAVAPGGETQTVEFVETKMKVVLSASAFRSVSGAGAPSLEPSLP